MAIVNIKKGWTGVEASGSGRGKSLVLTTTEVYTVLESDLTHGPLFDFPLTDGTVTIPARGTDHPVKSAYKSLQPSVSLKAPGYFEVKVQYQTVNPSDPDDSDEDPLAAPAVIGWGDSVRQVEYDVDLDGTPVANVLGQLFEPRLTREVCDPVLTIERNEAAFDPDVKLVYQDTVCSEVFWGAAVGRARLARITAQSVEAETPYDKVRYEVVFRMKTPTGVAAAKAWWRSVANTGTRYKPNAAFPALGTEPTPNGEVWLLKANGEHETNPASVVWLYFREFADASWASLGINNP
jgi:hypothetical protein